MLEAALAIDGSFPWALQNLGCVMLELGDRRSARQFFERAITSKPDYAEALASLADVAEKEHQLDEARRLVERALLLTPNLVVTQLVLARLRLRASEHAEVESQLKPLLANSTIRPKDRATAFGCLGQALEGLGRYDEAYAAFAGANDIERGFYAGTFTDTGTATSFETIVRLTEFMQSGDEMPWPEAGAGDAANPVFFVGFPRSGTTLLDQVLASHPDIETLEENDNLADAVRALVLAEGGLSRWEGLSSEDIEGFRSAYWRRVDSGLGRSRRRAVFVDKLPLNVILLPLIHRLFPAAKVILALRDPRDVAVSCFRNRFAMNAAMYQFLSLETTARYYDAVMRLGEAARKRLPLRLLMLRYEDVVDDFRSSIGGVLEFLELEWTDDVTKYAEAASQRNIRTPSATQVIQPLYRTSIGQWRHYAHQLEPVMPILDRWVRAFGYEPR